jgi:hypothetical protein
MPRLKNFSLLLMLLWLTTGSLWAESHEPLLTLQGRVQPAGPSIYMEGSHELVDSKGHLIARLSGARHEVDLAAVAGQWVSLRGCWRPTVEAGGRLFEVCEIERSEANPE